MVMNEDINEVEMKEQYKSIMGDNEQSDHKVLNYPANYGRSLHNLDQLIGVKHHHIK